ncbi:MAG TPA: type 2 isopentenyl-diphosphate Delta-isomerase [Thermoplasmata archaeon]|nr:type 2 isopentenyl-diphosphate Delta-isomerase [Thermoplasmata archaeon]
MNEERKKEHVEICLTKKVNSHHNYWDNVRLFHNALPEVDKSEVNLKVNFLGKQLAAPLVISGMTGGYPEAKKINRNLAIACEKYQIALGVGSQRAALDKPKLEGTYTVIKDYDLPLRIANIGLPQLIQHDKNRALEKVRKCVEMIDANAIALHLNFLQEAIQPEGSTKAKGCLEIIRSIASELGVPLIIKETGAGISYEIAKSLASTKISAIEVGGLSGTSFATIESYRAKAQGDYIREKLGQTFREWGIPTPVSILEVKRACKDRIPIVGTGGIRNGLDAAKSIALGAQIAGIAGAVIREAVSSAEEVAEKVGIMIEELRTACFLCGTRDVADLSKQRVEMWYGHE